MSLAKLANELHQSVSSILWTVKDVAVAQQISQLTAGVDATELYTFNCQHFARQYNAAFFLLSSSLWRTFHVDDWAKVIKNVRPRPEPTWAWDGGEFSDISFVAGRLKIDVFQIARDISQVEPEEARKIEGYGFMNSEILIPATQTEPDDDEEFDEYEPVLNSAIEEARTRLLTEAPSLDLSLVSASQLRERLLSRQAG